LVDGPSQLLSPDGWGKEPTVTISDYDTAMKAAIARVFPDAISMICVFHVNKNVVLHIKRKWDKQAAALVNAAQVAQNNHQDADDKDDVEEEDRGVVNRMNRVSRGQVDIGPPPIRRDHSQWEGVDLLAEDEADHPEASGLSTTATRGSRGDRGSRGGLGSRGGRGGRDGTRSNAESDGNNGNINRVVTGRVVRATRAE
jgi:hypothetical protein